MSNANNYQKAIVMLSAEPLDNEYLEEFQPRLGGLMPEVKRDLSVAPSWFPREVADAETIALIQPRWTRADSALYSTLAVAVIGGVGFFVGWEVGVFLAVSGLINVAASLAKKIR